MEWADHNNLQTAVQEWSKYLETRHIIYPNIYTLGMKDEAHETQHLYAYVGWNSSKYGGNRI